MLGRGGNGFEVFTQLGFRGGKAPVATARAQVIHPGQDAKMGMGIQTQPRYTLFDLCFHKRTIFGFDGPSGLSSKNNPRLPETLVVRFSNCLLRNEVVKGWIEFVGRMRGFDGETDLTLGREVWMDPLPFLSGYGCNIICR